MVSELVHAIKLFFKSYEFLLTCSSKLSRVSQMAVMGYEKGREKNISSRSRKDGIFTLSQGNFHTEKKQRKSDIFTKWLQ